MGCALFVDIAPRIFTTLAGAFIKGREMMDRAAPLGITPDSGVDVVVLSSVIALGLLLVARLGRRLSSVS